MGGIKTLRCPECEAEATNNDGATQRTVANLIEHYKRCHSAPRIAELEAENAKLEDDLEWREKMLQSLHDQGYIVYVTGASVMPPRPDCESTFVMGSVSRFTTEGSDG